ncbi:MAG: hypothetical protein JWM28_2795 [Chitinophagaceae bacterium]|nr:hypothetical protein [Chitinophagaceae bacterium]
MSASKTKTALFFILPLICFITSCTRNQVNLGSVPENDYSRIVYIDTVGVQLSTVLTDSFSTSNPKSYLLGKYTDPYLGVVSGKPFFQLNKPSTLPDIPDQAVYDSLTLILRINHDYYGDTTSQETVYVNELSQSIVLGYNNLLYNNSNVEINPIALGSKTIRLRPATDDSIIIRLDNAKGAELFSKLKAKTLEMTSSDNFLNYFKGLSLSTGINDTSIVYGLMDTVIMRVNYHTSTPFTVGSHIDFVSQANAESFNQILTNRTGTGIVSANNRGVTEIPSAQTKHLSFTQPATGLYLKLLFPSLKGVILSENIVRLLKAELIIRPLYQSFDRYKYMLPASLYLVNTNGTNIPGGAVATAAGSAVQSVSPVIDNLYGQDNYYSFDVTTPVNTLINTAGSEDDGFFLVQGLAGSTLKLNRLVVGDATIPGGTTTQLKLSVLVINK